MKNVIVEFSGVGKRLVAASVLEGVSVAWPAGCTAAIVGEGGSR